MNAFVLTAILTNSAKPSKRPRSSFRVGSSCVSTKRIRSPGAEALMRASRFPRGDDGDLDGVVSYDLPGVVDAKGLAIRGARLPPGQ
jgi:hypothetical protein